MTERHLSEAQIRLMQAARAMLAALKTLETVYLKPLPGPVERAMAWEIAIGAIAQAERAGITTGEE